MIKLINWSSLTEEKDQFEMKILTLNLIFNKYRKFLTKDLRILNYNMNNSLSSFKL